MLLSARSFHVPRRICLFLAGLLLATLPLQANDLPSHPLDPFTQKEIWAVRQVMVDSGKLTETARFTQLLLHEPDKQAVLDWRPGHRLPRQALVVISDRGVPYEALVDLDSNKLASWAKVEGAAAAWTLEELMSVGFLYKDKRMQAALSQRGISDVSTLFLFSDSAGSYGVEKGRRLLRVNFFDRKGVTNFIGRPIGGLTAVVDAVTHEVVEVIDTGVVPAATGDVEYDSASVEPRRIPSPVSFSQPGGPGFEIDDYRVSWQNWSFHFRVSPRVGVVISDVRYRDGDRERRVLYQGHLSEIFVPYMDPSPDLYHRAYFDAGEFGNGMGLLNSPLEFGRDVPDNAVLFDSVHANAAGMPTVVPRAMAIFERYDGSPAWRHGFFGAGRTESRRRQDLVVRSIATLGNYDYIFDWVFQQNGAIKIAVAATGLDLVKGVAARTAEEGKDDPLAQYGRWVDDHVLAVNHDHFFSFRLDLDIDGAANSFQIDRLRAIKNPGKTPRRNVWTIESEVAATETSARMRINLEQPALWRLINPSSKGPMGYPVSYQIRPGRNARFLMPADDQLSQRAGFTNYHLWVTPQSAEERYAAGVYPNLSEPGLGLPRWTKADRDITDRDLVVWYTLGFHHVVRAEDWPIMSTAWHELELRPFDFFERNPAIDLPEHMTSQSSASSKGGE